MVLIKLFLSFLLLTLLFILVKNKDKFSLFDVSFGQLGFPVLFFLFRILPFIFIYFILKLEARSDVQMFYDSALGALKGGFVYKDFPTAYSPLFPYMTMLPLLIFNSAKSILFQMIMLEGFILWGTLKLFNSSNKNLLAFIYLLLPSSFVFSVLGGQEDVLMWGVIVLVLLSYRSNQSFFGVGVILGLGLLLTKFLLILIFPAIFVYTKSKIKFVLGLLAIGIPSLLFLYFNIQLDFLSPIQQANDPRLPNFWSILHVFTNGLTPFGPKWLNWFGLFTIILGSSLLAFRYRKIDFDKFLPNLFILLFIWLMIIQQSSLTNYAYNFMMPMLFLFYSGYSSNQKKIFFLFNVALVVQPAVWWGQKMKYLHHWSDLLKPINFFEYSLELVVVGSLIYFLLVNIKKMDILLADK